MVAGLEVLDVGTIDQQVISTGFLDAGLHPTRSTADDDGVRRGVPDGIAIDAPQVCRQADTTLRGSWASPGDRNRRHRGRQPRRVLWSPAVSESPGGTDERQSKPNLDLGDHGRAVPIHRLNAGETIFALTAAAEQAVG